MTSVVGLASGSLPGPGLPPGSAPGPRIATRPRRFGPGRSTAEPGRRTAPSCPGHGRLGPPSDGGRRSRSPHSGPPVDSTSVATTSGRPGPTPTASAPVTPDTPAGRSAAPGRPRPAWSRRSRDTPGIGPGRPSRGARSTRPGRHRLVVRPRRPGRFTVSRCPVWRRVHRPAMRFGEVPPRCWLRPWSAASRSSRFGRQPSLQDRNACGSGSRPRPL